MLPPPAPLVLARYTPALTGLRWSPVSGGFSGAEVWRGDDAAAVPVFALKAWPPEVTPARLKSIHVWIKEAAHLAFVPRVRPTADGDTSVSHLGRVWDVTRWMPGTPRTNPSIAEVETACVAVARLHNTWTCERVAACPGVLNRLRILFEFRTRLGAESQLQPLRSEVLNVLVRRAWSVIAASAPWAERMLRPWETVQFPLQPCVRDLRAEHVLFLEGPVAGIVDYGAIAIDHPAVDLARLLGDFDVDETKFSAALRAYRREANATVTQDFVRILEQSGRVCSAVNWLFRLLLERRVYVDEAAVLSRLSRLLDQIERFAPV